MTEALATLFEEKEIRVIEKDGEPWFPLGDLAAAWGIDRNTPYNLIIRNAAIFEGMYQDCYVTYQAADAGRVICVNERGLYLMLGRINADRLKNPEAKAAIIRFQRWVPELIQRYRKKEIVQVSSGPDLHTELERAKILALETGGNLPAFQKIALGKCGMGDYAPALDAVPSPAVVRGETGWYNPSQLVARCNDPLLTAERLNYFLMNRGFQYREGYIWRLTPLGMEHGKEYWYTAPSQHQEIRISWRESVLYASGLKRPMPESQTALPARAGVS
jgi:prophage antirepressor-like protein